MADQFSQNTDQLKSLIKAALDEGLTSQDIDRKLRESEVIKALGFIPQREHFIDIISSYVQDDDKVDASDNEISLEEDEDGEDEEDNCEDCGEYIGDCTCDEDDEDEDDNW